MSTHEIPVVEVQMEVHPDADNLAVVRIGPQSVCVRRDDWAPGALAAWIPPDYVVPDREEYRFLCACVLPEGSWVCRKHARIRARRLRGLWSFGLLIPAPPGSVVGDDVMAATGITRYEPPETGDGDKVSLGPNADTSAPPPGVDHVYDVQNWYRYPEIFQPGELLVATEKIHGSNARYTFREGQLWAGSRRRWLKRDDASLWWRVLAQYTAIEAFLRANSDVTLYGEIYGMQDLRYGKTSGEFGFAAFDVQGETGRFWDWTKFEIIMRGSGVPVVPWLAHLHYDPKLAQELQELSVGQSKMADHLREGIVVRPVVERWDETLGRVQLKLVSPAYLERAK